MEAQHKPSAAAAHPVRATSRRRTATSLGECAIRPGRWSRAPSPGASGSWSGLGAFATDALRARSRSAHRSVRPANRFVR